MGWRFRKSFSLGGGFRINLSKSGIGYSWGIPGYRKTKMANGRTRRTYTFTGTGISYIDEAKKAKAKIKKKQNKIENIAEENKLILGETTVYKNDNVKNLSRSDELFGKISKLRLINFISNMCIVMVIFLPQSVFFVAFPIIGVILKVLLYTKWSIFLDYEMDDYKKKEYGYLLEGLSSISSSSSIWQINDSTKILNTKYNAGANDNVSRFRIFSAKKLPFYIKCDTKIISFSLKKGRIFFLPDKMMFFSGISRVYGREYGNTNFNISNVHFIEHGVTPRDVSIVGYTWQYVNKDGGADKHFGKNKQLPICNYGNFNITSIDGINTRICFSNVLNANKINESFTMFGRYFNDSLDEKTPKKNNKKLSNKGISEDLYERVKAYILSKDEINTALVQKKFAIGYNKASSIISRLKDEGYLTKTNLVRKK